MKRRWGKPLTLITITHGSLNAVTGDQALVKVEKVIKRAIYLPQDTRRDRQYDLAFLATGVNFVHGGLYDKNLQKILIDAGDIKGFDLKVATKARLENSPQEFDVKYVDKYNNGEAFILTLEGVVGVNNGVS